MAFSKKNGGLSIESKTPDLSLKFYLEQIEDIEQLKKNIKNLDINEYQAAAILHDKDTNNDDFWAPAAKKPHIHLLIWRPDKTRRNVSTFLNVLGVKYRPGIDDSIIKNGGIQRIKDLSASICYLTHETKQADLDGKYQYDRSEIISNVPSGVLDSYRNGYKGPSGPRLSLKDKEKMYNLAVMAGQNLDSFDLVKNELGKDVLLNKSLMNMLNSYYLDSVIKTVNDKDIKRICIFIQGPPGIGKSTGIRNALKGLGVNLENSLTITESAGTGKYDRLTPKIETLILDDVIESNLLAMADNRICDTYRRGANNNPWCGKYLIITSNLDPDNYFRKCDSDPEHLEALKSRFNIIKIVNEVPENVLYIPIDFVVFPKNRGLDCIEDYNGFVVPFLKLFMESLNEYKIKKTPADKGAGGQKKFDDFFPLGL